MIFLPKGRVLPVLASPIHLPEQNGQGRGTEIRNADINEVPNLMESKIKPEISDIQNTIDVIHVLIKEKPLRHL